VAVSSTAGNWLVRLLMMPATVLAADSSWSFANLVAWQTMLMRLLGGGTATSSPDSRAELVWTHFPTSWGVFVLLGCAAAAGYTVTVLYRREMNSCPPWMKTVLASLRCASLLLIACILLGLAAVTIASRTLNPTVVIARDASASMQTADARLGDSVVTRAAVVNRLLSSNSRLLKALSAKGRLEVFDFADQPHVVGFAQTNEAPLAALQPAGGGTNLAAVIEEGLRVERPATIVLFSDGQHTAKDDAHASARKAKLRGVPIFAVGIGDPRLPERERVVKVISRPQAWQGEPFEIEVFTTFQDANVGQRHIELFEERLAGNNRPADGGKLVAKGTIEVPTGGSGQTTFHFARTVDEPGQYVYRARLADSQATQPLAENDSVSDVVKVLSRESVRVLLVAGSPTWDYRLVQSLLSRDKTMAVSCWLQSLDKDRVQDGTRPIGHLPQTRAELFEYDVILLFDPDPAGLGFEWCELAREFVGDHSGGLLYMAGPKFTAQMLTSAVTNELTRLLPVKFADLAALSVESLLAANDASASLAVVAANADHPVLGFFADRNETVDKWQSLPGVFWSFPASEAAPTAQVLIELAEWGVGGVGGRRPIVVAGRFGAGNTVYLGLDATWRWRSAGRQAEYFDKFWIQTIRFLAEGRSLEGRHRGYVQTDRERYQIGQRVNVSARLLDGAFVPLVASKIDGVVEHPSADPQTISLLPVEQQPGRYQTALTALDVGLWTIHIPLPDATSDFDRCETTFTVELPALETSQVWLNRPLLEQLAAQSGGRYFEVSELDELAAAVPNRVEKIEERSEPRPLWDVPGMLIALVGLLSTEWLLRRQFSLL
jgi:hypothetical protein